jgi:hypothetical protein
VKKSPKIWPNRFFGHNLHITITIGNSSTKIYFCNFQKMHNRKNRPIGENSPNLVTLSKISLIAPMSWYISHSKAVELLQKKVVGQL